MVPFMAGLATLGIPVVVFLYLKTGFLFLEQPLDEGEYLKAPNWASLLHPWTSGFIDPTVKVWNYAGLLITALIAVLTVRLIRNRDYRRYAPLLYIAVFCTMTVAQKNAVANYAYLFMLPLVFSLVDFNNKRQLAGLLLFNAAAAVHPSLWWRIGQPYYRTIGDIFSRPVYVLEYALEIYLIGYFLYLIVEARQRLRERKVAAFPTPGRV